MQRLAVLSALFRNRTPRSAEQITASGKGAFDLTTAYRTLDALVEAGAARKIRLTDDRALYELALDHHHHAICTSCGTIKDVSACLPAGLHAKVRAAAGFGRVDTHALEFFGLCRPCARKAV